MARSINKDKIALIASEYCTNGYDEVKALTKSGYSKTYSQNYHKHIFNNSDLKEAIAKIQARNAVKTDITVEYIQSEHARLAKIAEEKGDLVNATRNLEGLGKSIAAYTDKVLSGDMEQQEEIDKSVADEARRLAELSLRADIKLDRSVG